MCRNSKIISSTKNGELSVCNGCKTYSLIYNNILFQLDKEQLLKFRSYIANIDIDYWLNCYSCTTQKRKIPINTLHQNLVLIFKKEEIHELMLLLILKDNSKEETITASEIDYPLILN